jgi:hypothetical protein
MNAKLLVVAGLAAAAVSANATITLATSGNFSLGGVFTHLNPLKPTYTANSSIASIAVNSGTKVGAGTLNQWWFSVVDSSDITTVSYSITVTGVTSKTNVSGLVSGWSYNSTTGAVGSTAYIMTPINDNVETLTGSHAFTQTLTFTENIANADTKTAFFKGNFQLTNVVPEPTGVAALAIGALGLLIRRRRTK